MRLAMFATLLAAWAFGCASDSGPEMVEFEGRNYAGVAADDLDISVEDVTAAGEASSVRAGGISDATVLRLDGVTVQDAIILRRDDGSWALFVATSVVGIDGLCPYYAEMPSWCS